MADHLHKVVSVEDVHDGDTFTATVALDFFITLRIRVRIKDLWCPELDEPGGEWSLRRLEELLLGSSPIEIRSYKDEMSFARWVCDVWVNDNLIAAQMIVEGYGFRTKKEQEAWVLAQTSK